MADEAPLVFRENVGKELIKWLKEYNRPAKLREQSTIDLQASCFSFGHPGHTVRCCRERKAVANSHIDSRQNFDEVVAVEEFRRANFIAILILVQLEGETEHDCLGYCSHLVDLGNLNILEKRKTNGTTFGGG
ncbi:hypothetical protein NPIL_268511 [Nephila pilipes]|uniref:Uncharacterized protein n=1 Tax=Nephila pilipes TaxID=299642 RepID=A0A8X6PWB7_NEPPI|nr:hypothetical protein NPIL_268511 [Nephila pilipes]